MAELHETRIGQRFLDLVPDYLKRIAEALEKIANALTNKEEVKSGK